MTVVIVGDRVAEIGNSEAIRSPKTAATVNAAGKFLIPGL
jgi:imidazolonepropionase-like amidohydrolase